MKIPVFGFNRIGLVTNAFFILVIAMSAVFATAQKVSSPSPEAEGYSLNQCRNGNLGNEPCDWTGGNVGVQNSQYTGDEYLPYRLHLTALVPGTTYQVVLGYDIKNSSKHAIDYLGSYNTLKITNRATDTASIRTAVDPCGGLNIAGCSFAPGSSSAVTITKDTQFVTNQPNPNLGGTIYQPANQEFRMWGNDPLYQMTFAYVGADGTIADAQTNRTVRVTFKALGTEAVLGWSGHVGWAGDWGNGEAAGNISGSPYHMNVEGIGLINGGISGGAQDVSLSASAIDPNGTLFVRKEVFTPNQCNSWNEGFGFTASANFGAPGNVFQLFDTIASPSVNNVCNGNVATPGVALQSATVNTFNGVANVFTITEGTHADFDLDEIVCTQGAGTPVFTPEIVNNELTGKLTVRVDAYKVVTCTFRNLFAIPTAAPANVSGRVVNSAGRGISGLTMELVDLSTGASRLARTNTFGYYMFADVETTLFYSLTAHSKRYTFSEPTRFFTLNEETFDMNFYSSN